MVTINYQDGSKRILRTGPEFKALDKKKKETLKSKVESLAWAWGKPSSASFLDEQNEFTLKF